MEADVAVVTGVVGELDFPPWIVVSFRKIVEVEK